MGKIVDATLYFPESTINGKIQLFATTSSLTIGVPPNILGEEDRQALYANLTKIVFYYEDIEYFGRYSFHGKAETNFVFDCNVSNIYQRPINYNTTKYTINFELRLQGTEGALFTSNMKDLIPNVSSFRGDGYICGEFTLSSADLTLNHLSGFLSHMIYSYSKYQCTITVINHSTGKMETESVILDSQKYLPESNFYSIQGWQHIGCPLSLL